MGSLNFKSLVISTTTINPYDLFLPLGVAEWLTYSPANSEVMGTTPINAHPMSVTANQIAQVWTLEGMAGFRFLIRENQ